MGVPGAYSLDRNEVLRLSRIVRGFLGTDKCRGHGAAAARWYPLLCEAYPELAHLSLSAMLVRFGLRVHYVRSLPSNADKLLQFLEYWSGIAEMMWQRIALGLRAAAFDKLYAPNQDVTTPEGLRLWLDTLTATEMDSTHWNGNRCSSFGGMCKAQSGRRIENQYTRHTFRAFVRDGNRQADCLSLLVFFSCLVQNEPILEQPAGSVLPKMVPLKTVFEYFHFSVRSNGIGRGSQGG